MKDDLEPLILLQLPVPSARVTGPRRKAKLAVSSLARPGSPAHYAPWTLAPGGRSARHRDAPLWRPRPSNGLQIRRVARHFHATSSLSVHKMAPYSLLVTRLQVSELRCVGSRGRGACCSARGGRRGQARRARPGAVPLPAAGPAPLSSLAQS